MLTSRERIRHLLAGEPLDRIPNGLGGCETAGLHLLAHDHLQALLGVPKTTPTRMSSFMTTALVEPPMLDAFGGDLILMSTKLCPAQLWGQGHAAQWTTTRFWGETYRVARDWTFESRPDGSIYWADHDWHCPSGGIYFDPMPRPTTTAGWNLSDAPTPDQYAPLHDIPDERLRQLEESARWLYENTPYAIVCGEEITDLQYKPGGSQAWWMRLASEPQVAHEFLAKAVDAALDQIVLLDQAVGQYADMMQLADDIGDVRGVTIGPDLWREIYKPHYRALYQGWHERTRMKVSMHGCGATYDVLGDLVECGVDVYNPVQISAQGMAPERLKAAYGDRLIFYGGCFDAVQTPPSTSADEVYETVKRNLRILSKGGGYLFSGVHNVPGDTPVSHLEAILRAYQDCRDDPELLNGGGMG